MSRDRSALPRFLCFLLFQHSCPCRGIDKFQLFERQLRNVCVVISRVYFALFAHLCGLCVKHEQRGAPRPPAPTPYRSASSNFAFAASNGNES